MKENGIFVGVGDVNQAMKALVASFTSHNFAYYAGAFTKQPDYLQYAKELAEADKLHTYIDKVYSANIILIVSNCNLFIHDTDLLFPEILLLLFLYYVLLHKCVRYPVSQSLSFHPQTGQTQKYPNFPSSL